MIWEGDFHYRDEYSGKVYQDLRDAVGEDFNWDWLHLGRILKFGYDYEFVRTPFDGIRRRAAMWLPEPNADLDLVAELKDACRYIAQTISEPIPILASGGIDSSIVTWILAVTLRRKVQLYHADNDEYNYFSSLVEGLQKADANLAPVVLLHTHISPTDMEDAAIAFGDPVDLGSLVKQWRVFTTLKGKIKHLVTGDGADELFGGYRRNRLFDTQLSDVMDELTCYHIPRVTLHGRANDISIHCPYLSERVMSSALALPYPMRYQKLILRDLAQQLGIPASITGREKKPFVDRPQDIDEYRLELINLFRSRWNT